HGLPDAGTRRVHVEALRPAGGSPDLGMLPYPTDPPVLHPCHVPHQPGNVIGVEGRLPAHLRRRQALKGALQVLQVFLQTTLDSFFEGAHSRCLPQAVCRSNDIGLTVPWPLAPNATRQALEIAGATTERRLFPVACTRWFGTRGGPRCCALDTRSRL